MNCFVYKSARNPDMYLYISTRDDFSQIPESLMEKFGKAEYILSFDLSSREKLGREEPQIVIKNLRDKGYHLQLPENMHSAVKFPDMH